MQGQIELKAGKPYHVPVDAMYFVLTSTGAAPSIKLRFSLPGGNTEDFEEASRGLKLRLLAGNFIGIEATAAVDCTVKFLVSQNAVDVDFVDGATVTVSGQVDLTRGAPGAPLSVTAVTLADSPAVGLSHGGPVGCGPAAVVIAPADAARRALRIMNLGPDPVAIGPAGITWAQRVLVLEAGDFWFEDRAANLAWSAITDAGKAASVNTQRVTA